jgi:hypothetical protein
MAVPVFVGSSSIRSETTSVSIDISTVANGSWIVVSAMASGININVTPPNSWSVINAGTDSGTRRNFLFTKIKDASDGTSVTFTQNIAGTVGFGMVWGTGGGNITAWTIGSQWLRGTSTQASGSRNQSIIKGLSTPLNDQLVLAIGHEATQAKNVPMEVTNVTPTGWTQRLYLEQVATTDHLETIWIGSKDMATAGSTGDVTLTYDAPQDNNAWTIQIAIASPTTPQSNPVPVVVGTPTTYSTVNANGSFTISRPAGATTGDYILVAIRAQISDMTVGPSSSGFTRLGAAFVASDGTRAHGMYGRPVSNISTEPASYTFTYTNTAINSRMIATAIIVRGVDLANPLSGYANSYTGTIVTGPPAGKQVDTYTTDSVPTLSLFMGSAEFSSPNDHTPTTLPTNYSEVTHYVSSTVTTVSRTYLWIGAKTTASTSVPAAQILWSAASGSAAEGISLRGTAAVSSPSGTGIRAYNGSGAPTSVYYTTSSGPKTPSALVPMRRGFANTVEVLNTYGTTWAHRGGSDSYPEMSLYGYTQSVMRGYGVLEVSLARTSDGVWFGLHDQTTDRTSGGTFGTAASQTWAQVEAQNIRVGAQGSPQPYMRWDKFVATYGSTHVVVVDPKYTLGTYRTEFLNMIANDIGVDRAIIKFSGVGSGAAALASAAQTMGFQTWGFFYAGDASAALGGNGSLQTWGSYWTTIGMEYGASQAIWNEALALGKPVIGHIAPNQAAYNAAMSKGAIGVQVSGVGVVRPISWWNSLPKFVNLLAEYSFNEATGSSVIDSGFRSNNLTIGTQTDWTVGHTGTALHNTGPTGTGAYNSSFTNPTAAITLMGWVNPQAITGEVPLFGFFSSPNSDPTGTNQIALYASRSTFGTSNVLTVNANINATQTAASGAQMTINTWQHVAATFDGTTLKLFLNGITISQVPQSGSLGVGSFVAAAHTNSSVDDIRVFNTALTQTEIVQWMNRSL